MAAAVDIVPLQPSQIEAAGAVLGRAFMDDPLFVWVAPNEGARARFLRGCMTAFVRYAIPIGEGYTTAGEVLGAAIWLPPERTRVERLRMLRAGVIWPLLRLGPGSLRFARAGSGIEGAHDDAMSDRPHWYLMDLGVEPSRQGQRIGSALMQPMLARTDAERLPCYLETQGERNLPLYQRHGFELLGERPLPGGGPTLWNMKREPKG